MMKLLRSFMIVGSRFVFAGACLAVCACSVERASETNPILAVKNGSTTKVPTSFLTGTLQLRHGCLGLANGPLFSNIIWVQPPTFNRAGNAISQRSPKAEIPIGSRVRAAGGRISKETAEQLLEDVAPERCGTNYVFVQNMVRIGE